MITMLCNTIIVMRLLSGTCNSVADVLSHLQVGKKLEKGKYGGIEDFF